MKNNRVHPAAVGIRRESSHRIYVFGGRNALAILDSCEFLDVDEGKWTLLEARMASPRKDTCAVLLDHTTVVICGGFSYCQPLASCESLDLVTHTFSPFPGMLEPHCDLAGVHYNGTIVVIAGRWKRNRCEQFDPTTFKWTPFAPTNQHSRWPAAVVVEGNIYATGEYTGVEVYDGSLWSTVTRFPRATSAFSAVALEGKFVVINNNEKEVHIFDPATASWSCIPNMPDLRGKFVKVSF